MPRLAPRPAQRRRVREPGGATLYSLHPSTFSPQSPLLSGWIFRTKPNSTLQQPPPDRRDNAPTNPRDLGYTKKHEAERASNQQNPKRRKTIPTAHYEPGSIDSRLSLAEQVQNLRILRKPAGGMFAENEVAAQRDVEYPAASADQLGFNTEFVLDRGRQTGSLGQVVSFLAVCDGDIHACYSFRKGWL